MSIISKKTDKFLQGLIDERRQCNTNDTMIDHLLSLQQSQPQHYTDEIIKGLVLVSIVSLFRINYQYFNLCIDSKAPLYWPTHRPFTETLRCGMNPTASDLGDLKVEKLKRINYCHSGWEGGFALGQGWDNVWWDRLWVL